MKVVKKLALILIVSFAIISCGNKGNKFIGTWSNPNYKGNDKDIITISSNGSDSYLVERQVRTTMQLPFGGGSADTDGSFRETAKLEGDNLQLNGAGNQTLSLVNGNLLFNSHEYSKQ